MAVETRTWEEVLAEVEADAARAAALLAAGTGEAPYPVPSSGTPVLPALAEMPPVPDRLRERIEGLRDRIAALQAELADALRQWQLPPQPVSTPAPVAAAHYLDRRI